MRKLILKMHVSIDGFVAGSSGGSDWIFTSQDDGATAWVFDTLSQAGVHIMGSHTFREMAPYWPYSRGPFAAPMNDIPKIVYSGQKDVVDAVMAAVMAKDMSPRAKTWREASVIGGDLSVEIARLKNEPGEDILAHGGARFAQSLARLGLIDEYRLLVHPVALGQGLTLFSALSEPVNLKLINSTAFAAGAIANVYWPA